MAEEQQFCLRWNNFQVNITSQFEALRDDEDFVDVTLACEGKRLKAHKVVLSACSPYFKDLFKSNPCKHPILFMRDVEFHHLQSLVEFMYAGEVNIAQAQLSAFLRTAESLQIRGLTEAPQRHKQMDGFGSGRSGSVAGSSRWGAGSPGGGSRTPSPEEAEQEGEEEMLSLSPPCSPPPAKRSCQAAEKPSNIERSDDTGSVSSHHRSHSEQFENVKNETLDIVEPKVEIPDYCSDGEGRTDNNSTAAMYQGMDNSVDMTPSFQGLQGGGGGGGMDILPGPSAQNYMGDTSQDSGQADQRKLHSLDPRPCPICYRMYSNLSNLRQHLRLIHNPQTVSCPLCSKPFKTKLYLKRHLMSFHELVCTTPKAGAGVAAGKGEFFTSPQMPLGKVSQPGDDRNGVQNSMSPAKPKDTSAQDLVAEFFQTRSSYQPLKGSNVGGSGFQKNKIIGHNEDRSNLHAGYDVNPFHLRNQDRYPPSHANKNQDVGNYLPPSNSDNRYNVSNQPARNVSGDRSAQYHSQSSGNSQDGTPAFLNLLSLTKNEDNVSYVNPQQSQSDDAEKGSDNTSVEHESKTDVTS
ncbi:hypothetical protein R5R35_011999 [Gryllus longicercus]|uniref:Broad-complex core protein n=1 Tax=Gryllus longicercus TaxID=2509291 RepID=A0AAN9Z6G8_9ORTH